MALVYFNPITAADGTTVTDPTTGPAPTTGTNKLALIVGAPRVRSSRMSRANTTTTATVKTNETIASADYEVSVVVRRIGADSAAVFRVFGRLVDNNNYYFLSYFEGDGILRIRRQVSGSPSALSGGTATFSLGTLNTAQDYTIMLRMSGTTIEGYVDGVKRVDGVDSTYTAAGQAGMSVEGTSTGYTGTTGFDIDSIQVDTLGGSSTLFRPYFITG